MGADLAETLAERLEPLIEVVREPYRTRLLEWLRKQMGYAIWPGERSENLDEHDLASWLREFDAASMVDQFVLIEIVCDQAARIFGDKAKQE